jgi:hypothetical protein
MMRALVLSTLSLTGFAFGATSATAETDAERAARCAGQAQIVSGAVDLRRGGADEGSALARLEGSDSGIDPKYAPSISVLVGWIYSLHADQMTAETATAFETQCLGYKP